MANLFPWIVNRHIKNLAAHIAAGGPADTVPDENKNYPGLFIVSNGETLWDRLQSDNVIRPGGDKGAQPVRNEQEFNSYLDALTNNDGGHVHDGVNKRMMRAGMFEPNNVTTGLVEMPFCKRLALAFFPRAFKPAAIDYETFLPEDFLSYDRSKRPCEENLGVKLMSAVKLAVLYPHVDVFLIKQTPYGRSPADQMGKAIHLNKNGLCEEFYFLSAPACDGPFFDPARHIIGVYKQYERINGNVTCVADDSPVTPPLYWAPVSAPTPSSKEAMPAYAASRPYSCPRPARLSA